MATPTYIVIDKVKWFVYKDTAGMRIPQPLCPEHHLRLTPRPGTTYSSYYHKNVRDSESKALELECAEGPHRLVIPREFNQEKSYVIDRIDALIFEKATYIYLDDRAIPVALDEIKGKDSPIWVRAKVTESKSGLRLIVWAGDKSAKTKTQLFVEPSIKRLSFDQNDDHPTEVFTKVEALFKGNVETRISSPNE